MYESASFHYCEGDVFDLFTFHTLFFLLFSDRLWMWFYQPNRICYCSLTEQEKYIALVSSKREEILSYTTHKTGLLLRSALAVKNGKVE